MMIYPDKREYPLGAETSDGRRIATCYGAFFAYTPAPSWAGVGFYFFRLVDDNLWYWQEFDLTSDNPDFVYGPIHGPHKLRREACEMAAAFRPNVLGEQRLGPPADFGEKVAA